MTESFENYLKTILILQKRNGQVLCSDVAAELGYSRASVTIAVRKLREHGCLKPNSRLLVLTERGQSLPSALMSAMKYLRKCWHRLAWMSVLRTRTLVGWSTPSVMRAL